MDKMDKKTLIQLLELVEDNLHTSASSSGLYRRGQNNVKMERILCAQLKITTEEADEIYWKYIERLRK